jgi:ribosomal protein S18 acetylase RimI-like enzyme
VTLTRRPKQESDREWVRDTHHVGYHDVIIRQFGGFSPEKQEHYFEQTWKRENLQILLKDGKPCGYTVIEENTDHIRIQELVLRPEFQKTGIGTIVLKEVFEDARAKHVPIKLNVLHENEARRLYARMGFVECGGNDVHTFMERPAEPKR